MSSVISPELRKDADGFAIPGPVHRKRMAPAPVEREPFPNLAPPDGTKEVTLEYFRKLGENVKWKAEKEKQRLLVDSTYRAQQNKKFVAFTQSDAYKRVFKKGCPGKPS